MQYLQVGSKPFLQQFGSGVQILCSFQIYFDELLCSQETSMTESHGQNSALNSMIKPLLIAKHDFKMLIYEKWHHFNTPHHTKSNTSHN